MPECYTHTSLANRALMRSGQIVSSFPAFMAGANGPNPFYFHQKPGKRRGVDFPALAERMHREDTGRFLNTLVGLAATPIQQSFVLGFLSHYAVDCVMHPFIDAMCAPGGPYHMRRGHEWMEISLDSTLYYQNYRTYLVPLHTATPVLVTEELAQVTSLLHSAILQTYGLDLPPVALADSYHNLLRVRRALISRWGIKKALAVVPEKLLWGKKGEGTLRSHMQPGPPLKPLPATWQNPATGEEKTDTLEEMLSQAMEASAICISGTMRFWLGKITAEQLAIVLGDNDYYTGQPSKHAEEKAPQTK